MRRVLAALAVLMAAGCSACSGDGTTPAPEPLAQAQPAATPSGQREARGQSTAQPSLRPAGAVRSAEPRSQAAQEDVRNDAPPEEASTAEGDPNESDAAIVNTTAASDQSAVEEPGSEPANPRRDLTAVPATLLEDADVRVRPGLPWRVVERLPTGESVLVRQEARGWLRIRYGEDLEGWIRSHAVGRGEIDELEQRGQPAALITAEWRGVGYGVMGQSADGAAVYLLRRDGDQSEMVSAPMGEVTLSVEDITLDDLPVLIGDETVVFPGDVFRAGQGKILPKANEWMWLPSGRLLAHNDEHIWRWRPETDQLEFVRRPLGFARLSPGGESLAILTCDGEEPCRPYLDVTILPLDGAPRIRLQDQAGVSQRLGGLKSIDIVWSDDFMWTSDGRGLLIPLVPESAVLASAAALLHADRGMVIFDPWSPASGLPEDCSPAPSPRGLGWSLSSSDRVTFTLTCASNTREATWHVARYDAEGRSIEVGPALDFSQPAIGDESPLSTKLSGLSDDAFELRGGTALQSIVVDPGPRSLFLHEKSHGQLREVADGEYLVPEWLWELIDLGPGYDYRHWDLYWSADKHVAVIARTGFTHIAAAFSIDLTTASAVSLPIGAVRTWPCYPTGGWSPDGTVFQVEFHAYASERWLDSQWIDGVALAGRELYQRQFVNTEGQVIGILRAAAFRGGNFPPHLARWSPDGAFFAVGGHQSPHHCYGW